MGRIFNIGGEDFLLNENRRFTRPTHLAVYLLHESSFFGSNNQWMYEIQDISDLTLKILLMWHFTIRIDKPVNSKGIN